MEYKVDAKEIGKRLRELRGYKPRRVVAQDVGISERALIGYENGERIPRDEVKIVLSNYYNIPIQQLFFCGKTTQNE